MKTRTPLRGDLLELAPVGHAVTDDAGIIVSANGEFLRLAGRDPDDVVGKVALSDLFTVAGRIFLEAHLMPRLQAETVVREVALELVTPAGDRVPVLLNARLLGGAGSRAMQAVTLGTDERRQFEDTLLHATQNAERARAEAAALAERLQKTLIPPAPPSVPHLDIAAAYRPAGDGREVGGDFYDVFQVTDTSWLVVLGDVSGKGVTAAAITALVRHSVRTLAIGNPDPVDLLHGVDRVLTLEETDHYCTLVVVRLDRSDDGWDLRISLAGHPPPLLRAPDGTLTELGVPGSPAGLLPEAEFTSTSHRMGDGVLIVYTDGVTEARGVAGMYGEERLYPLLSALPHNPHDLVAGVVTAALDFQDDLPSDDIAIVAFASVP